MLIKWQSKINCAHFAMNKLFIFCSGRSSLGWKIKTSIKKTKKFFFRFSFDFTMIHVLLK